MLQSEIHLMHDFQSAKGFPRKTSNENGLLGVDQSLKLYCTDFRRAAGERTRIITTGIPARAPTVPGRALIPILRTEAHAPTTKTLTNRASVCWKENGSRCRARDSRFRCSTSEGTHGRSRGPGRELLQPHTSSSNVKRTSMRSHTKGSQVAAL